MRLTRLKSEKDATYKTDKIEEFYMRAKLLSQEKSQGKRVYKRFFEIYEKIRTFLKTLNEMWLNGLTPADRFTQPIPFDSKFKAEQEQPPNPDSSNVKSTQIEDEEHELDALISEAERSLRQWKLHLRGLQAQIGKSPEHYYLLFFMGKKLNKLTRENFKHSLKLINSKLAVDQEDILPPDLDPTDSRKKLEQILDFFRENQDKVRLEKLPPRKVRLMEDEFRFRWDKVNYLEVRQSKMHESILVVLNSILRVQLELNQIFHCSETTTAEDVDSKRPETPNARLRAAHRAEHRRPAVLGHQLHAHERRAQAETDQRPGAHRGRPEEAGASADAAAEGD